GAHSQKRGAVRPPLSQTETTTYQLSFTPKRTARGSWNAVASPNVLLALGQLASVPPHSLTLVVSPARARVHSLSTVAAFCWFVTLKPSAIRRSSLLSPTLMGYSRCRS